MTKRAKKKKAAEAPKAPEASEAPKEEGDDILMSNESFEDEFGPETAIDKEPEPEPKPEPEAPAPAEAPSPRHPDAPPVEILRGEYETKHAYIYLVKPECYKKVGQKKIIISKRQA